MENSLAHGIGVKNRYALFYDEDLDPLEILRQQEEEKQKRKNDKTQTKDKSKPVKSVKLPASVGSPKKPIDSVPMKTTKVSEANESSTKPRAKQPNDRFPRNAVVNQESKDIEERKNIRNKDDQFFNSDLKERDSEFRRGRGGFRGRGGRERGRGYFMNPEGKNRRVFDRHSGSDKTGVRPVDKREGAGSNNWGDIRSDINQRREEANWDDEDFDAGGDRPRESVNWADEEQNTESAKFGKPTYEESVGKSDAMVENLETKENEPLTEEQIEDTVKQMTLDEWKREQEAKRVVPKYNLRKPGEGEDEKQWKKFYVLKKKAKEEDDDQDDDDDEVEDEDFGRKQHRQLLDIQINFSDSRRGTRGRGRSGRGGPRSGRDAGNREITREGARENRGGRGGGRESSKTKAGQQSAPRVDDFNDFPSLANA